MLLLGRLLFTAAAYSQLIIRRRSAAEPGARAHVHPGFPGTDGGGRTPQGVLRARVVTPIARGATEIVPPLPLWRGYGRVLPRQPDRPGFGGGSRQRSEDDPHPRPRRRSDPRGGRRRTVALARGSSSLDRAAVPRPGDALRSRAPRYRHPSSGGHAVRARRRGRALRRGRRRSTSPVDPARRRRDLQLRAGGGRGDPRRCGDSWRGHRHGACRALREPVCARRRAGRWRVCVADGLVRWHPGLGALADPRPCCWLGCRSDDAGRAPDMARPTPSLVVKRRCRWCAPRQRPTSGGPATRTSPP